MHAHAPHNIGRLKKPTMRLHGTNAHCGDDITIELMLSNTGVITDCLWQGSGCAISRAAASILTDYMKGKKFTTIQHMKSEAFLKLLQTELSPARITCALLPLFTIKSQPHA